MPGRYRLFVTASRPGDAVPLLQFAAEHACALLSLKVRAFVSEGRLRPRRRWRPPGWTQAACCAALPWRPPAGPLTRELPCHPDRALVATFRKTELPSGKIDVAATLLEDGTPLRTMTKTLDQPLSPPGWATAPASATTCLP